MKIGNLYDMDSFKAFMDSGKKPGFTDAYAGTVLARNLTAVDPTLFEKKYPELTFVNSGIVGDNTGGYARRIQSLRVTEQGDFKTAGDASDNQGKISLGAEDSFLAVLVREAESDWSDDEVKEADMQGINLVSRYVESHNKLYMRNVDQIGYLGVPDKSTSTGLLNYTGFTSVAASGVFSGLTAIQMYNDVSDFIQAQWNAVSNTPGYMIERVVMPVSVLNLLQATILDTTAGSSSVLRALQDNYPSVSFFASFRATTDMVGFATSRDAMVMRIPQPLTIGEIIKSSSFKYNVESKYRIAGLDVLEDTAGYKLTGVAA